MRPVDLRPTEEKGARGARRWRHEPAASHTRSCPAWHSRAGAPRPWGLNTKSISDKEAELAALEQEERQAAAKLRRWALRAVPRRAGATLGHSLQPRPEPLRLGAGHARALPRDPQRRLAGRAHRHRRPRRHGRGRHGDQRPPDGRGTRPVADRLRLEQDSVASFVTALEDIDGVTRVGVAASERPEHSASGGGSEGSTRATAELAISFSGSRW